MESNGLRYARGRFRRARYVAALGGIVGAAAVLAGIGSSSASASGSYARPADAFNPANIKVGFSAPYGIAAFVTYEMNQTNTDLKAAKFQVLSSTNANQDNAQQVSDIENLVSEGAKGIIVDSNDSAAIVPALQYAQKHGVVVVPVDVSPTNGPAPAAVTANQRQIGVEACKAMAKGVGFKGKVLSLEGSQSTYNGRERTAGFAQCMKAYPHITLIQKPTNWVATAQAADVQTVLEQDPDLKGIYQQAGYALSATLEAVKQAGHYHLAGQKGHIYMVAVDGDPQGLQEIRHGQLDVEISQPALGFAQYGSEYLEDALKNPHWTLPLGKTNHQSTVINFDGIHTDELPAVTVTKANVNSKALWGNQVSQ